MSLVTCIMPTRNRRQFVGQSIQYFLRQDYSARELLILDDGEDPVADLVPDDIRIRYVRLVERAPIGAKRNMACEMSRGELIAHWDDDDWFAPEWISSQVNQLLQTNSDVCGTRDVLYYKPSGGEAWLYQYPVEERPWVAGNTLLYKRSYWSSRHFPEINVGEDNAFVCRVPSGKLCAMPNSSFHIGIIHGGNVSGKNVAGPRWQRWPLDEVTRRLAGDRDFYVCLRNGGVPRQPKARPALANVTVAAHYDIATGYGSMSEYLVRGMSRAGANVNILPLALHEEGLSDEFCDVLRRSRRDAADLVLYCSWPRPELQPLLSSAELYMYTMWEADRLPRGWAEQINRAKAVMVPTKFVAKVFRESGVSTPIEVVPEGIDPEVYYYVDRPETCGLTTLIVGPLDDRKHVREGIAAWKEAFRGDPDARLIIKTQYNYQNYVPDDPRIRYVDVIERTRGILHWYRQADVLLALGNEGFGLPMVEAMATGLPVIALDAEGQADVCAAACDCLLPVKPAAWQAAVHATYGDCGLRSVPAISDVAARLGWVANHRQEAREMGRVASQWAREHRNVWAKGAAVLDVIERHSKSSRPLRRVTALWTPTWQSRCGIAEYTADLSHYLPAAVKILPGAPDLRTIQLLHVQHEEGIFRKLDLASCMQQARSAYVPVVVTEHSVDDRAREWERDTRAIVSLNTLGVAKLKARWPEKRIEYIPHGCPTWFPPRKTSRAKVIGAFGFLSPHKGFWSLLDVLRQVPKTELLLFSHSKSAETETLWEKSARGLPVRRIGEYLPAAETVRRLAAQADILVFWYNQVSHVSASGAIRVALATGVPVLASPTPWFHDLRGVTYQPESLLEGVERLLEDTGLRENLVAQARHYCHENNWSRVAQQHLKLWQNIAESN